MVMVQHGVQQAKQKVLVLRSKGIDFSHLYALITYLPTL